MASVSELESILKDQRFWNMDTEHQSAFVQESLRDIYGESFTTLAPERQQKFVEFAINEAQPHGLVEKALSFVPIAGPFIEQYGYGRQVKASPLAQRLVGEETATQYGAAISAVEDLAILGGSALALGLAAPTVLAGTAIEGISLLANHVVREATIGGLYEVGKLITTPPASLGEAVGRIALSAGVAGVAGGALEGASGALRGKFGELLASPGNKINTSRLVRELGGSDEYMQFAERLGEYDTTGDISRVRDSDIAAMLRAAGERRSESAQQLRAFGDRLLQERASAQETLLGGIGSEETTTLGGEASSARITQQRVSEGLRETEIVAQEQIAESQRRRAVDEAIAAVEEGQRVTARPHMTKSETMLVEALRDPAAATKGFIGQEPVTLPLGMIDSRNSEAIVVERFNAGQGILRGGKGFVPRSALRMAQSENERLALDALSTREGIGGIPSRSEALDILRSRVAAEQAVRRADLHAMRGDFATNATGQLQEFELRRSAVGALLDATNRDVNSTTLTALRDVKPLVGNRIIGSLDAIPSLADASDAAHALAGAGFENVRVRATPDANASITFTRGASEAENNASQLYARASMRSGIIDTTTRTYSGLTATEHETLGRAFGIAQKQLDRFNDFVNQTLDDASARGIRVPASAETLGIEPLETQVTRKARSAQPIRSDAIVDATRLQRFEKGDWITLPRSGATPQTLRVADEAYSKGTPIQRSLILADEHGALLTGPGGPGVSEEALRAAGAQRDITRPLGVDPHAALTQLSPARTLEALLNPESRAAPFAATPTTRGAIGQAARDLGMRSSVDSKGNLSLSLQGTRLQFATLEDAAEFIDSMRSLSRDKQISIAALGGQRCL